MQKKEMTNAVERGVTLWFTGLSGSGKSTLAQYLLPKLREHGKKVEILDGDEIRENLSKGLGFSKEDRDTNIRRIGFVANLLARNGIVAITAAISPYRDIRNEIRSRAQAAFVEVFVRCPIDVLEERDTKGLYKKARAGIIKNFTGVNDPYEEPESPEIVVESATETIDQSAEKILQFLRQRGLIAEVKEVRSAS
jgi:adenylyl-sulfate kinase